MPRKTKSRTLRTRRRMRGHGKIIDWFKRAAATLRKNKTLSRLGSAYGSSGLPGSSYASKIGGVAAKMGYGRRRRGRGLGLAGGALRLAGSPGE